MFKNTSTSYGVITKLIHWVVAIAVVGMFALGLWMVDLSYYDEWNKTAPYYHKSAGILLAIVMMLRVVWRLFNLVPQAPETHTQFEKRAAYWVHLSIYVLIFLIIIAGYLISTADNRGIDVFGWFEVPSMGSLFENQEDIAGNIHRWLGYALMGLVSVHALAALKHHFIDKDNTLKRMT